MQHAQLPNLQTASNHESLTQRAQRCLYLIGWRIELLLIKHRQRMAANSLAYWQEWEPIVSKNIANYTAAYADHQRAGLQAREQIAALASAAESQA